MLCPSDAFSLNPNLDISASLTVFFCILQKPLTTAIPIYRRLTYLEHMTVMTPSTERIRLYFDSKLKVHWNGVQGTAHCPFHADNRPSFSINAEEGVFFCHS